MVSIPALCKNTYQTAVSAGKLAWRFRTVSTIVLAGGVLTGLIAYLAGPLVSSALCGLGGAALTLAGMILYPIYRLIGEDNQI
jgi:hypothetical protein